MTLEVVSEVTASVRKNTITVPIVVVTTPVLIDRFTLTSMGCANSNTAYYLAAVDRFLTWLQIAVLRSVRYAPERRCGLLFFC